MKKKEEVGGGWGIARNAHGVIDDDNYSNTEVATSTTNHRKYNHDHDENFNNTRCDNGQHLFPVHTFPFHISAADAQDCRGKHTATACNGYGHQAEQQRHQRQQYT